MSINLTNTDFYFLVGIAALFFIILILFGLTSFIKDFFQELKNINNKIIQTHGQERKYWIHRRRKLWLSLIPFVKY